MRSNGRAGPPGLWRVLVGDCREVMRELPAGSVDACIADPPYRTTSRRLGSGGHATTNPEEVLQPLIEEACPPGGVVLDPFCGSGAVGCAALLAVRRILGIEIDAHQAGAADEVPAQLGRLGAAAAAAPGEGSA